MVYNAQESIADTPRLQRGQKLSQALPHPVRVLFQACEAGKGTEVILIGCKGRGREAMDTCGAEDQEKLLLILPETRCRIWIGFEMTPRTDSRPYFTVKTIKYKACYWFRSEIRPCEV